MLLLLLLTLAANVVPQLDGAIGADEWKGAQQHALKGGGEVLLLQREKVLYVAVRGEKRGIASLCVGDGNRVSVLHASAALGTAEYAREGDAWRRRANFKYEVREAASDEAKAKHRGEWAWLANASRAGTPVREFAIELTPERQFLAVAFVTFDGGDAIAYWPEGVRDDCAALRLAQGWAEETQTFAPATWYRVARR